ncbi:MAG TPA: DUF1565 domain-containing protein [Planctomycetota bacterium]|nr:DUF1565 domain-containing protein [Planctomycetota bacterium]
MGPLAIRPAVVLAGILLLPACGDEGDTIVMTTVVQKFDFYVDAALGNDRNAGTIDAPFRRITYALGRALPGDWIKVAHGTYDAAHGELFPLPVFSGVRLIGDEAGKGDGPAPTRVIVTPALGQPSRAFTVEADGLLAGFRIENPGHNFDGSDEGVRMTGVAAVVRNNTITSDGGTGTGLILAGATGSSTLVWGNVVSGYDVGVSCLNGLGALFEDNVITGNAVGVHLFGTFNYAANFGNGPGSTTSLGSLGGNVFSGNSTADVLAEGTASVTLMFRDNFWDHVPPSGNDIVNTGSDTLDTTGARLAPAP